VSGVIVCPPPPAKGLRVRGTRLAVGFGVVVVKRNGEAVWSGDDYRMSLYRFERQARELPGTWTVDFIGPLSDSTYERVGLNRWVLTRKGMGFA
jgi:hypothetical protein